MGKKILKKKQRQEIQELIDLLLEKIKYFKEELNILNNTLQFTGKRIVTDEYKKILDYIDEKIDEIYASLVIKIISTIEQIFKEVHKVIFNDEYYGNYMIIISIVNKIDKELKTKIENKEVLINYIQDRNELVHEAFSIRQINQVNNYSEAASYIGDLIAFIENNIIWYYHTIRKSKK